MNKYKIALHGCDDSTYIKIELSEEQADLIKMISGLSKKESTYGCMPVMEIKKIK